MRASSLRLDPEAVPALVASGAVVIDVRRHDDVSGFLDGAVRIPPDEIPTRVFELPRGVPILLACT